MKHQIKTLGLASFAVLAGTVAGCEQRHDNVAIGKDAVTQAEARKPVGIEFGDMELLISADGSQPYIDPPGPNRLAKWVWLWPGLQEIPERKTQPTADERASEYFQTISFRMAATQRSPGESGGDRLSASELDNNDTILEAAHRFHGPVIIKDGPLLEYRRAPDSQYGMFYVSGDGRHF